MEDKNRVIERLINELTLLRARVAELEASELGRRRVETELHKALDELEERTVKPAKANARLKEEIAERQATEEALRQSEEALQASHQQLLGIVESLPDATFVVDQERKIIAWNRATEDMTGTPKEEILGKGNYAYSLPFYGERRPMMIDRVFDGSIDLGPNYDFVKKQGNTLYAEAFVPLVYSGKGAYLWITASPLYDRKGNRIGAIESIRDISEHKKMEEALRMNAEKIQHFAYCVSHDLKSPITGINGLIRLLHRQYRHHLDDKGKKYCDQILKASEMVLKLVEEINIYIKTREMPLDFEPINPKDIIRLIRDEFGALLSIRQISLTEPQIVPEIRADRLSILRVFRNLVDNALKYGGKGLTEIRISYQESEPFHIFTVSDDGVGLRIRDQEKIFGVFQRDETAKGVEGTGLGLAIVREIAEKHQGKVGVEPGSTKGTTFYVYISKNL